MPANLRDGSHHHAQHNRTGNRERCVEIALPLLRRSTEIQHQLLMITVLLITVLMIRDDANPHRKDGAIVQLQLMARISQTRDQTPNTSRRMLLQRLHLLLHQSLSLPLDQLFKPVDARLVGCDLRLQIGQ